MSSLMKNGFVPFGAAPTSNAGKQPLVLDMNERAAEKERQYKIIRSAAQKNDETEEKDLNISDPVVAENKMNEAILSDALYKAKELRDDAQNKAIQIIANANAEAEGIFEQAKQSGYEAGLEEGNMEAMRRADVYLENIKAEEEQIIEARMQELSAGFEEKEKKLVDFAANIIEKFTGVLVEEYKPVMLHMINSAVSEEDASKHFTIRVSEDSYGYISDNKDRIIGATNPNIEMEIFGDVKLDAKQCIIETDNGIIDLSMDVQVKNLITAMKLLSEN